MGKDGIYLERYILRRKHWVLWIGGTTINDYYADMNFGHGPLFSYMGGCWKTGFGIWEGGVGEGGGRIMENALLGALARSFLLSSSSFVQIWVIVVK